MLTSDWMKATAILLHLVLTAWVLSQCQRFSRPADQQKAEAPTATKASAMLVKEKGPNPKAPALISKQAKLRADKRKAHEDAVAEHRARYQALEADLVEMTQKDIPAALGELAQAAIRYRNKLSDLKHLKKAEQWEREAPVKDAHARARALTEEWYKIDREAQKGEREGPTLHVSGDMEALTKRLAAFKRGGEEIASFAAGLAPQLGKVPESLILSAIDAIPRAVLPKDAYDPCRDPAACPRPAAVEPLATASTALAVRDLALGMHLCIDTDALAGRPLPLRTRPDFNAPALVSVMPRSCRLSTTGRHIDRIASGGSLWIEVVHDYGHTGWAQAHFLRRQR